MSKRMPRIFMPDPDRLPDGLSFSPGLVQNYKTLPGMYLSSWESFGDGSALSAPRVIPVSEVSGSEKAHIANYPEWVSGLETAYKKITTLDSSIGDVAARSKVLCDGGRDDLSNSIEALHVMATISPKNLDAIQEFIDNGVLDPSLAKSGGNLSEDEYVMAIMDTAVNTVSGVMQKRWQDFENLGSEVRRKNPEDAAKTPKAPAVPGTQKKGGDNSPTTLLGGNDNATIDLGNTPADSPAAPPVWNWDSSGPAMSGPRAVATTPTMGAADVTERGTGQRTADHVGRQADGDPQHSAPIARGPASDAGLPAGASGLPNYALPMAMMAAGLAGRGRPPSAGDGRPQELSSPATPVVAAGPASGVTPAQATPPPARSAPTSAAAAANSPAAPTTTNVPASGTQAGSNQSNHPQSRVTAPTHAVAVSRSDDGSTIFTFPDGRAQRVSIPVANALTAALGNAATTDGRSAYDTTTAKIPEGKDIGTPTDPNVAATGDLASWGNRTALVVAFPAADGGGTLEVIVEGQLCRFESRMSDKHGDFGQFGGFFHPAGVDISATDTMPDQSVVPVLQSADGPATVPA